MPKYTQFLRRCRAVIREMLDRMARDREIANVERALKRTSESIDAFNDRWHREQMGCCPSCAFGHPYAALCAKYDRQAAWLVVLLFRRDDAKSKRRIEQLSVDSIKAGEMARHLRADAEKRVKRGAAS